MTQPRSFADRPRRAFTFAQRLTLGLVPRAVAWTTKLLGATCRVEIQGKQNLDEAVARGLFIMAFWHESMLLAAWRHRGSGYHTLTSHSYDGELAARTVAQFGLCTRRGSSSEGGAEALAQLMDCLKAGKVVGLTADGPRGPRRVAKPGVAILSVRSQTPILPCAFIARPAWRLNSWDKTAVPKPFSTIIAAYGKPMLPPSARTRGVLEATRLQVEQVLNRLHADLDESPNP